MTKTTYITKPIEATEHREARASETFIRSPDGNKRKLGNGEFENTGRLVYCSLDIANEYVETSRGRAKEEGRDWRDIFSDNIIFAPQMPDEPGGIIFYKRLSKKDGEEEKEEPRVKRSYSLVEKIEEK